VRCGERFPIIDLPFGKHSKTICNDHGLNCVPLLRVTSG
jgi:hypothetical protein